MSAQLALQEEPMKTLALADNLHLNAEDFIEAKVAIIGQSGRGKSGLLKVVEEELVRLGLPFVVFDPAGVAWGIRSSVDGKGPGLPVLVIGGDHGDLPLNPKAGAEVARAIVEANVSAVLDFSAESKAAYRGFVKDFSDAIFTLNKSHSPRVLIFDEAPDLLPQNIRGQPEMAATFYSVERLVRMGRNNGLGAILVSQRMATIAKDAVTQCGTLVVFGLVGPQDRKALKEWVEAKADPSKLKEFEAALAGLQRREAFFWSPELDRFERIRVREYRTFHPDRTNLRRMGLLDVKPVTTDIQGLVKALGGRFDKIKADRADAAEAPKLRAQVARLTRELETARSTPSRAGRQAEDTVPLKSEIRRLKGEVQARDKALKETKVRACRIRQLVDQIDYQVVVPADSLESLPAPGTPAPRASTPAPLVAPRRESSDSIDQPRPTGGALRMLRVLAALHPTAVSRIDLGAMAAIAPNSGTFSDYLSLLRRSGYAEDSGEAEVRATSAGVSYFEAQPTPPTHEELVTSALGRVSGGARRMLQELVNSYPDAVSRSDLGERAAIASNSGTFSDYLSLLRRLGFVKVEGSEARASEVLFP